MANLALNLDSDHDDDAVWLELRHFIAVLEHQMASAGGTVTWKVNKADAQFILSALKCFAEHP